MKEPRPPRSSSPRVTRVMKANRARDTGPELSLRKSLFTMGLRGYRLADSTVPGRPDIVFRSSKLAVFVHGCYWHRCPAHGLTLPKTHVAYWRAKFARNVERDARKIAALRILGWKALVLWECEIADDAVASCERVRNALRESDP
jgi:DNA mismatch endonuclease, patch repair protein